MLKSMVVILAIFGSVSVEAKTVNITAIQDQKAAGGFGRIVEAAVQDQKAAGGFGRVTAVQDQKAVSLESQVESVNLLDLNEGF